MPSLNSVFHRNIMVRNEWPSAPKDTSPHELMALFFIKKKNMINVIGSRYLYTFFSTRFCLMLTFCITRFFFFNGKVRNFIIGRRNYITANTSSIIYLFLYKIEFFYNLIKCICVKFFLKNLNFGHYFSHLTPHKYLYL